MRQTVRSAKHGRPFGREQLREMAADYLRRRS